MLRHASWFQLPSRCLEMWWNTRDRVWYITSKTKYIVPKMCSNNHFIPWWLNGLVLPGILIPLSSFLNRIWLFKVTIAMPYFAIENHSFNIGLRLNWEEIRSSCPMKYVIKMKLTNACESISRVSRKTRAVEWSFGVCTVRISMTVVCIDGTFVDIWKVLFHIFFQSWLPLTEEVVTSSRQTVVYLHNV